MLEKTSMAPGGQQYLSPTPVFVVGGLYPDMLRSTGTGVLGNLRPPWCCVGPQRHWDEVRGQIMTSLLDSIDVQS